MEHVGVMLVVMLGVGVSVELTLKLTVGVTVTLVVIVGVGVGVLVGVLVTEVGDILGVGVGDTATHSCKHLMLILSPTVYGNPFFETSTESILYDTLFRYTSVVTFPILLPKDLVIIFG